jgi:hypothetical protein
MSLATQAVSSVNINLSKAEALLYKSLMWIRNKIGPKILLWIDIYVKGFN